VEAKGTLRSLARAARRFVTHLSIVEGDETGNSAKWGAHVTDEEYATAPSIEET
jgi:hypothetical protein